MAHWGLSRQKENKKVSKYGRLFLASRLFIYFFLKYGFLSFYTPSFCNEFLLLKFEKVH